MSFQEDSEGRRRRKSPTDSESAAAPKMPETSPKKKAAPKELGQALRSAYDRVVDEDIPPELLDLLGKLG